jgi:hypothetical protein
LGNGPEFVIQSKPKNKKPFHNKRRPAKKDWNSYELWITNYQLDGSTSKDKIVFWSIDQSPKILIS